MVEQPGDYLRNHPHFIQGRAYEKERIVELLNELGHKLIDADAKTSAKTIALAIDIIEGRV